MSIFDFVFFLNLVPPALSKDKVFERTLKHFLNKLVDSTTSALCTGRNLVRVTYIYIQTK